MAHKERVKVDFDYEPERNEDFDYNLIELHLDVSRLRKTDHL